MKLKPFPISKAKNAYDLVSDVARAILDEPRRADMDAYRESRLPEDGGPACGTAGCFAGWIVMLRYSNSRPVSRWDAEEILGYDLNYWTTPYGPFGHVFDTGDRGIYKHRKGTREYARAVVRRIRRFQQINKVQLRARVF